MSSVARLQVAQLNPLSYAAPARVQAFLCPVGSVTRSRFIDFVGRLQSTAVIHLGDVTPDSRPERVMFSPQGFPTGVLVYNFCTTIDSHHTELEDLELFRRPLVVFGLADYNNISDISELRSSIDLLRSQNFQAIIHKIIVFDCPLESSELPSTDFICVPPKRISKITSIRTVLCDLTSAFLAELPLLAHAFQLADLLASPSARDADYDSVTLHSSPASTYARSTTSATTAGTASLSTGSLPNTIKDNRTSMPYPLSHHTERQRMRRKGRAMKMIANIYLLAGRTTDAIKEYAEALAVLKGVNDHLWYASCVEGIGICMLILSHLNVQFTVPSIVLAPINSSDKLKDNKEEQAPPPLIDLLPQLTSTVLNLFNRAQNFPGENVPSITIIETILRTVDLLTCTCLAGGWTTEAITAAIFSDPIPDGSLVDLRASSSYAAKMSILNWISAAQNVQINNLDVFDASRLLTGIAAACGKLGFMRKRAFVLQQLVTDLVPKIIRARNLEDPDEKELEIRRHDYDTGILNLLEDICNSYGIPTDSSEITTFGWKFAKTEVLRSCINLCQVLPDYIGVVRYTSLLFRLSASELSLEEQVSYLRNFKEAYSHALSLGLEQFEDDYWDPYLIRDVSIVESSLWAIPKLVEPKSKNDNDEPAGTFIYNPFAKKEPTDEKKHIFVLDEPVEFRVVLQNPFGFEIDIKAVKLIGEGAAFSSDIISVIVPPRKLFPIAVFLTPTEPGTLTITGCSVHVLGCAQTILPTIPVRVDISEESKIKNFGLKAKQYSLVSLAKQLPVSLVKKINVKVIPKLPVLRINRISIQQNSLMLLEGERRKFHVVLRNLSDSVSANWLSLLFNDSTTQSLLETLESGTGQKQTLSDSEIYEIEVFLYKRPALRWDKSLVQIPANDEVEVEIEVIGKRGLTSAHIDIEFSHADQGNDGDSPLHVRTLGLDIKVTVNASIELAGCDFVPFSFDMPILSNGTTTTDLLSFLQKIGIEFEQMESYCLMLLDLRNSWPSALKVEIVSEINGVNHTVQDTIQPGHTNRLLIPIKRIREIDARKPIPRIKPPKQYINNARANGSQSNLKNRASVYYTLETEREVFWYREELLRVLRGSWSEVPVQQISDKQQFLNEDNNSAINVIPRAGQIELRALRITPQMVGIIKVEDVVIDLSIRSDNNYSKKSGRKHWQVQTDEFIILVITITSNHSAVTNPGQSLTGILRIQPALRNLPIPASLDISRRMIFNGVLQQPIVNVAVGETRTVELQVVVLSKGEYEFVSLFEVIDGADSGTRYVGREKLLISAY
ncbi:TRAPP II complex [Lipomyces japonicus]|uniref:TRAPP II complex n=1 Tax=Lipomyces japonicus TaxID=56871 RepID=UPI0034CE6D0D